MVCNGKVVAELKLLVAGLISDQPLAEVDAGLERAKATAFAMGVFGQIDPFMTLSSRA